MRMGKKRAGGDIAKRSYPLQRLRWVNLTCTIRPGEHTFEFSANSIDPLQMVALVTRSREGFEKCENNVIELVGIFY